MAKRRGLFFEVSRRGRVNRSADYDFKMDPALWWRKLGLNTWLARSKPRRRRIVRRAR